MKIQCNCGQKIEVNDDAQGQEFLCPTCGETIIVPCGIPLVPPLLHEKKKRRIGAIILGIIIGIVVTFTLMLGLAFWFTDHPPQIVEHSQIATITTNVTIPNPMPIDYGEWKVKYETDPITDINGVVISLNPINISESSLTDDSLILRYRNHVWDGYISGLKVYGGENDYSKATISVVYRIDDLMPVNVEWEPGEYHNAIFIPNIEDFIKFKLLNHKLLVIRYSSSGRTETTTFNISGLAANLKDIASSSTMSYVFTN